MAAEAVRPMHVEAAAARSGVPTEADGEMAAATRLLENSGSSGGATATPPTVAAPVEGGTSTGADTGAGGDGDDGAGAGSEDTMAEAAVYFNRYIRPNFDRSAAGRLLEKFQDVRVDNWPLRPMRAGGLASLAFVQSQSSMDIARQLLQREEEMLYGVLRVASWSEQRDHWLQSAQEARTAADLGGLLVHLESALSASFYGPQWHGSAGNLYDAHSLTREKAARQFQLVENSNGGERKAAKTTPVPKSPKKKRERKQSKPLVAKPPPIKEPKLVDYGEVGFTDSTGFSTDLRISTHTDPMVSIRDMVMLVLQTDNTLKANQFITKVKRVMGEKVEMHRFQVIGPRAPAVRLSILQPTLEKLLEEKELPEIKHTPLTDFYTKIREQVLWAAQETAEEAAADFKQRIEEFEALGGQRTVDPDDERGGTSPPPPKEAVAAATDEASTMLGSVVATATVKAADDLPQGSAGSTVSADGKGDGGSGNDDGSDDDDGEIFEVDAILGRGEDEDGGVQYRVRWKGYGSEDDTWEPESGLESAAAKIKEFNRKMAIQKQNQDQKGRAQDKSLHWAFFRSRLSSLDRRMFGTVSRATQRSIGRRGGVQPEPGFVYDGEIAWINLREAWATQVAAATTSAQIVLHTRVFHAAVGRETAAVVAG